MNQSPSPSVLTHFKVRPSYATDAATATDACRRDPRRCGGRPHCRRLRDHPAAERAGAPCGSRASGSRGEGEGPGLRRAPRRGATGGRRRGGDDGRARDRQGGARCAAERRGPRRAGRSRSAPFDGAALRALRRRRPRRRDRPAQGRLGRARAGLGAADRHAQRGVRPRLSRPARHRARRRRLHPAGRAPAQRSERDLPGDRGRHLFRPCAE